MSNEINNYFDIGKLVKEKRISQKLTQEELAYMCGYSNVYICRIENGNDIPRVKVAEDIFNAMGYRLKFEVEKI